MLDINPTSLEGLFIIIICVFTLGVLLKLYGYYLFRKGTKKEGE